MNKIQQRLFFPDSRQPTAESCSRGMTLIDTVVGTALLLVIFLGVFAAFQLSVDVVLNNKARAGATALANERMEYIRSLTYSQIGTVGGIPAGVIPQFETITLNGIPYTRRTFIQYADDPGDGLGAADTNGITADYKALRSDVYWTARTGERHITVLSRMSPTGDGIETTVPGGTLTLNVVNALLQPVSGALIHIVNSGTTPASLAIDFTTYTNISGMASFIGATTTGAYQITVTKSGYSSDQTYDATAQNTNPDPGHVIVFPNQTSTKVFGIDLLAQKTINTWTPILPGTWTDTFADATKIASSATTTVAAGVVRLSGSSGSYPPTGDFQSVSIAPSSLSKWKSFTSATSTPAQTAVLFRFYNGSGTALIPDSAIPGNSAGLGTSTVSLLGVSTSTYPSIRVAASFTSNDPNVTPSIDSYSVAYDYGPTPLPNVAFTLKSEKTIGTGPSGTQYKYSTSQNSGASASIVLSNMEWDKYEFAPTPTVYDIASACHDAAESPVMLATSTTFSLAPGSQTVSDIYLVAHTTNALSVEVRSTATGSLIPYPTVRLYKTGYDMTQTADSCGQVIFSSLSASTYTLVVSASGYATSTDPAVSVSGTTHQPVSLN